jgi:hypothetical protein
VRIRLGSGQDEGKPLSRQRIEFTRTPYEISPGVKPFVESSAWSRGFKFAVISGIAAFLSNAGKIIVPESGQGALGQSLITVGQAGEDYRSHPLFARRMEIFIKAILGHTVRFEFPQIWNTKLRRSGNSWTSARTQVGSRPGLAGNRTANPALMGNGATAASVRHACCAA